MKENYPLISLKYDFSFKMFFGDARNKDLLISFLNANDIFGGDEAADLTYEDGGEDFDVDLLNPDLKREFADDKDGILDILVQTKTGKLVHIELQILEQEFFRERVVYYLTRGFSSQLKSGGKYGELKPYVSIIITDFKLDESFASYVCDYEFASLKYGAKFTDKLLLRTLELPKLAEANDGTELCDWLRFISESEEEKVMLAQKENIFDTALTELRRLSQDEKSRRMYEARMKRIADADARELFVIRTAKEQERAEWAEVVAAKDASLAAANARIAELEARYNA